jgi:hypothetical protein
MELFASLENSTIKKPFRFFQQLFNSNALMVAYDNFFPNRNDPKDIWKLKGESLRRKWNKTGAEDNE